MLTGCPDTGRGRPSGATSGGGGGNGTRSGGGLEGEQALIEDLQQAAVVVAATAYQLAMRDALMPRKPQAASN